MMQQQKAIILLFIFSSIIVLTAIILHLIDLSLFNLLSLFVLGYFFADVWELITCKYLNLLGKQYVRGWHYHHSVYGLVGLSFSLAYLLISPAISFLWLAWSAGIIAQHTLTEKRFVFISRD